MVATLFIRHVGDGGGDSCDGRGRREKKVVCVGELTISCVVAVVDKEILEVPASSLVLKTTYSVYLVGIGFRG